MKWQSVAASDDLLFFVTLVSKRKRHTAHCRDTWYEFLLKQFNQNNFDYGAWLERRVRFSSKQL